MHGYKMKNPNKWWMVPIAYIQQNMLCGTYATLATVIHVMFTSKESIILYSTTKWIHWKSLNSFLHTYMYHYIRQNTNEPKVYLNKAIYASEYVRYLWNSGKTSNSVCNSCRWLFNSVTICKLAYLEQTHL